LRRRTWAFQLMSWMALGTFSSRGCKWRLTLAGRVAGRPSAFNQSPAGVGVPGLGEAPLAAALPRGVFTGDEGQIAHELARILEAGEVAQFRDQDDSRGVLPPPGRIPERRSIGPGSDRPPWLTITDGQVPNSRGPHSGCPDAAKTL
jgi:hypothetical protein